MPKKQKLISQINDKLTGLEVKIMKSNKIGELDINKYCENVFCGLLNIVFDLELEDLNRIKVNFPAVDLGDYEKKVCIQVTSTNKSTKINNTIKQFIKHDLDKDFNRLIIFLLAYKPDFTFTPFKQDSIDFNVQKDILGMDTLFEKIEDLSLDKIEKINTFLNKHIGNYSTNVVTTPFDVRNKICQYKEAVDYTKFIAYFYGEENTVNLNLSKEEEDSIVEDFNNFVDKYVKLSNLNRTFVFEILLNPIENTGRGFRFNPHSLEGSLGMSLDQVFIQFEVLVDSSFAFYEETDATYYISDSVTKNLDCDLFEVLINYCEKYKIDSKEIFIDLNFSLLD